MPEWLQRWQERRITRAWLRQTTEDREILEQHFDFTAQGDGITVMTPKPQDCLFCAAVTEAAAQNSTCYIRFDAYPAAPGHLEVIPKRHVESMFDLTPAEVVDAHALLQEARSLALDGHRPDAYTIGVNEGRAAGRTIDHLHIHVIPRWHGDVEDPRGGVRNVLPLRYRPDAWAAETSDDEGKRP